VRRGTWVGPWVATKMVVRGNWAVKQVADSWRRLPGGVQSQAKNGVDVKKKNGTVPGTWEGGEKGRRKGRKKGGKGVEQLPYQVDMLKGGSRAGKGLVEGQRGKRGVKLSKNKKKKEWGGRKEMKHRKGGGQIGGETKKK